MSPLRTFGSLILGRFTARRIGGQAFGSTRLLHQSRNLADGLDGSGSGFPGRLPMGELHRSVLKMGALSVLVGGVCYFKEDPATRKLIHHNEEALEEESMEEKVMKKRFEEWMTKYGRTYKDKEEKAMRYELFKRYAESVDQYNAKGTGCTMGTTDFADKTEEVSRCCGCHPASMSKEENLMLIRRSFQDQDAPNGSGTIA